MLIKLAPFGIHARTAERPRKRFQLLDRRDLGLKLGDGPRRRRLIDDLILQLLDFILGRFLEVFLVPGRKPNVLKRAGCVPAALEQLFFFKPGLEPRETPAQRLMDGGGRGREAPLEDLKREADGIAAALPAFLNLVGAIHLVAHVARDRLVKRGFLIRELVRNRVGLPLRKEGRAIKPPQLFL